jgi:hypothetical protein
LAERKVWAPDRFGLWGNEYPDCYYENTLQTPFSDNPLTGAYDMMGRPAEIRLQELGEAFPNMKLRIVWEFPGMDTKLSETSLRTQKQLSQVGYAFDYKIKDEILNLHLLASTHTEGKLSDLIGAIKTVSCGIFGYTTQEARQLTESVSSAHYKAKEFFRDLEHFMKCHSKGAIQGGHVLKALDKISVAVSGGTTCGAGQLISRPGFQNYVSACDVIPWCNPLNYPRLLYGIFASIFPFLPASSVTYIPSLQTPGNAHPFEGKDYFEISNQRIIGVPNK